MRWRGRWLLGVAAIHTLFACVVLRAPLLSLWERGLFNTVGDDPMLNAATWFVFCGAFMATTGLAIDALERAGRVPRAIGRALLGATLVGLLLMPASGFWLILPVAISVSRGR